MAAIYAQKFMFLGCVLITVLASGKAINQSAEGESHQSKNEIATSQITTLQPRTMLKAHRRRVGVLSFSPDGQLLATGGEGDRVVRLWNPMNGKLVSELSGQSKTVSRLSFSSDGQTLETGSVGGRVSLWDVKSGKLKAIVEGGEGFTRDVTFSPDSRTLAVASDQDIGLRLYEVETGSLRATLIHPKERYAGGVTNAVFSSNGRTIVTAVFRNLYMWDSITGQLRQTVKQAHGSTIYDIKVSPDGRTLASASRDFTAKLWDVETGVLKATLEGHKGRVHRLAFSPDGRTLATGSDDKTARLWDVATGQLKATLQHRGTVWSVAFNADGRTLATGSDNEKVVKLWNAATGELAATLNGARYPAIFSPNGRTLVTASQDSNALLWDVPAK